VLFAAVGGSGVLVQAAALSLGQLAGLPFRTALATAILTAMSWNFVLNNRLTFRDKRLTEPRSGAVC
jgi:dolichol-phosphate mannosyltransferase